MALIWLAVSPAPMAMANRLICSSAPGPIRCAPRIKPVFCSTSTLNPLVVAPTRIDEYQPEVFSKCVSNSRPFSVAAVSDSPTVATGGRVKTTLGIGG